MLKLSAINQVTRRIEELILSYGVIALAIITVGNVLSRRLFNNSWSFAEEVSQFILVIITFMGISYATRVGRHIRMTAVYEAMPEKARKAIMLIISLVTMAVLLYLAYHAGLFVLKVKGYGRVTPALRVPFYLVLIWVPIGLFMGAVQNALTLIKNLRTRDVWLSYEEKSEYKEFSD